MPKWLLDSIEFSGGFLAGLQLHLPPGLTCIIGPRGSGKSTLMEGIRYGLTGVSGAPRSRLDLIQANLGTAMVTLRTVAPAGQSGYTIRRTFRQPASLVTADGKAVASVDLDRGTFLPLDAYSSTEIEAIADESLGEKRRALLDELRGEELGQIQLTLAERERGLQANADAIRAAQSQIADLTERIEELAGARARLEALPKPAAAQASQTLIAAAHQQQMNDEEASLLTRAEERLNKSADQLRSLAERLPTELNVGVLPSTSENKALMKEASSLLVQIAEQTRRDVTDAAERLHKTLGDLHALHARLAEAHQAQRTSYKELQAQNQAASAAVSQHQEAERAVMELAKLESERAKAIECLGGLRIARKTLKGEFLLERDQISTIRQEVARGLAVDAGPKVRIRVLRNADNLVYRNTLLESLKGARVRNHDEILECLMRLRPEQLAQIIADDDLDEFESHTSLGTERCRRILDAYRAALDPLALEVLAIDDRVTIELNVAGTDAPLFKDASELSRGQKCTALLPLLLARRDTPLLIDQPEDNLDNHFIFETVVESIRRLKNRRQMLFVTHNANIPVLAEADLVVVLNSDGKRGLIEKAGTLDECRDQVIELLEGGREAFERRRLRYLRA